MALIPLHADVRFSAWGAASGIEHVFLLHAAGNHIRLAFQQSQLPQLGINTSIVGAFNKVDLGQAVRSCLHIASPHVFGWTKSGHENVSIADPRRSARLSASLKLYVALYDMARRALRTALILEDDVRIHWGRVDLLVAAVANATRAPPPNELRVLFAGSYAPSGWDPLCCKTDEQSLDVYVRLRPLETRGTGLMPATGVVVSAAGARHLLSHLPIRDNNDVLLSVASTMTGSQRGLWYMKPYPFSPDWDLQFECMTCDEAAHPIPDPALPLAVNMTTRRDVLMPKKMPQPARRKRLSTSVLEAIKSKIRIM